MKTILKLSVATLFLLAVACTKENIKSPTSPVNQPLLQISGAAKYHIGESYGGGIIFYLDSTKKHGLIAATEDQGTGISWDADMNKETGAVGSAIGTGASNTKKIIKKLGTGSSYAADLCTSYAGGGFHDWFLPSKDELNQLYKQMSKVGGFSATNYWSSTEVSKSKAVDQEFGEGYQFKDEKTFTLNVRAVRAF